MTASRRDVLKLAWPIVLANIAVPLVGLTETAVIGRHGAVAELGAIALGSLVFTFVYWGFGFLRMGTTGFTAQAAGQGQEAEVRATLGRALLLGLGLGLTLLVLHPAIASLAFTILNGSAQVEGIARAFFAIRIWGAPATLGTFAVMGTFVGLGATRRLLVTQLVLNGLNAGLSVFFAGNLGMGARGIALGTACAEWVAFAVSLLLAYGLLRSRHRDPERLWPWKRIGSLTAFRATLRANADIMLRTLLLLFGFAWFTDQSARFGDSALAANHVLLQFISFSAFFLDGFAFCAEALVGQAIGARSLATFDRAVRTSTELAVVTAVVLAGLILAGGNTAIALLTDLAEVRVLAAGMLPFAAVYVVLAVWAFQLDGIFIGATRTRDMRNAALLSVACFLFLGWPLTERYGNHGLWLAFIGYSIARALSLGSRFPALRRSVSPS